MKIGIVCPYNIWRGGGVQECVLAIQKELIKRGHKVLIITPKPRNHKDRASNNVIMIGKSTDMKALATASEISASTDLEAIHEMLDKEQFDILHFHEPWVPFVSRQILSRSSSVNVATFHAKLPETVMSKTMEKVVVPYLKSVQKNLSSLSAVSPAAAEYVSIVSPESKITIIPNGIDLAKYQKTTIKKQSEQKNILFIGRLEKRKGLKYLLKAFSKLAEQDKNVRLIIAGDGVDRRKLEQWVYDNAVPRVKFLGYVSEAKKLKLLSGADLFCSPAIYGESFGIVLLEAMAMGAVTIAGNNPGYASLMQGRGRISLVNPKDTDGFVHRMELLLNDAEIRKSWQDWAKKYVRQFDYKKVVDKYEAWYARSLK